MAREDVADTRTACQSFVERQHSASRNAGHYADALSLETAYEQFRAAHLRGCKRLVGADSKKACRTHRRTPSHRIQPAQKWKTPAGRAPTGFDCYKRIPYGAPVTTTTTTATRWVAVRFE